MKPNLHSYALCIILLLTCVTASADIDPAYMGYFRDTYFDDSIRPVEIYGHGNSYTVCKPYSRSSEDNMNITLGIHIPDEFYEYPYIDEEEYFFIFSNIRAYFDPITFCNERIMHLYDFLLEPEFYEYEFYVEKMKDVYQGVTSYLTNGEPGIIQLVSCCNNRCYDLLGGERKCAGVVTVYLPGQVAVEEKGDDDKKSHKVYIQNYLTSGVDHAKLYITYDDEDAEEYFSDQQNATTIDTTCVTTYECSKSGKYLAKIVGYDKNGQELSSDIDTFLYVAPVNENDTWVARYTGKWYTSDNYSSMYVPIETKENRIIYQSKENPYTFKIEKVLGDKDFYFTMKTSCSLDVSSQLEWQDQESTETIDGDTVIFSTLENFIYGDYCLMEGIWSMTKYDSVKKTFCFPLFYYTKNNSRTEIYNAAYFTLENVINETSSKETSINNVCTEQADQQVRCYNINGQQTNTMHRGLNIIKSANGSAKVVMKK